MFYIFLVLGIIIRLILIPIPGFKADIAFWKGWGVAVADKGIIWLVNNTNYNYPPGFAYVLWVINKIYALLADPHNLNEYWMDGNPFYLFLIKLITIAADLLIVWLIIKISSILLDKNPKSLGKILALFYFLNPAVIYDGVVWGQVDQFGIAIFLLSAYLLFTDRPKMASAIFAVSVLMKFQNIIFIPLFYMYIFKKYSFREVISSLAVSFSTFIVVIFPFLIGKQIETVIRLLLINIDWFPWYSLNAFNAWWIASGLKGMQMVDKHLVFGIISANQFGLFMFIFAYFIASINLFLSKKEELFKNLILSSALAVFAFFHLLTQSHERYIFPVLALVPLLMVYRISFGESDIKLKIDGRKWKVELIYYSIFYFLLSIFFFLNMYLSMWWNYPDQAWMPFSKATTISFSWWISVVQIILFLLFFIWFFKELIVRYWLLFSTFILLLVGALVLKNYNYLLKYPISLTALKPVGYHQDYLSPVYDMTVEGGRGVHFWNRLSVNYYYYDKGIGSHADSEITYHLAKKFSQFSSDVGIDTEGDQSAKVYFSVVGDGKELYKTKAIGRFDFPTSLTVNVAGVNYLSLKITKAGTSIYGAHADWLDPIFIR